MAQPRPWQARGVRQGPQALGWKITGWTDHLYTIQQEDTYALAAGSKFTWTRTRVVGGRTNVWGRSYDRFGPDGLRDRYGIPQFRFLTTAEYDHAFAIRDEMAGDGPCNPVVVTFGEAICSIYQRFGALGKHEDSPLPARLTSVMLSSRHKIRRRK